MPVAEKFIKTEFRFSDSEEMEIIQDELSRSGADSIFIYDGIIEANAPVSSIELLKKKNILMYFLPINETSESLESINLESAIELSGEEKMKEIKVNQFLNKVKNTVLDPQSKQFILKNEEFTEKAIVPENIEINNDELIVLPDMISKEVITNDGLYTITFNGPVNSDMRREFVENEITLTRFFDEHNENIYISFLLQKQYDYLRSLPITIAVEKFDVNKKLTDSLINGLPESDATNEETVLSKMYEVALIDNQYIEQVSSIINGSQQATILDSGQNIIRIEADPETPLLAALVALPFVISLSEYNPPSLFCDVCRKTIGLDYSDEVSAFFGEEEIIGVIDSGIDKEHVDLKDRIKVALQYGAGLSNDVAGHGTHVAGIICGDGTASQGKIKGMAPKSQLVSVGVLDNNQKMDLPADIGKVLKMAVDNGAKIINLSWGYKLNGEYAHGAFSVDQFIYDNPEILVVVAAGNEGNAKDGFLTYKSVGVPATAKNVLTVGAASSRRTFPVIKETWGSRSPRNFPGPPQNAETLISNEDVPAVISSRGPTDYDSIKPEVIAPGNYILSAKAADSIVSKTNPEYYDEQYTFKTGTSMAAPVVSGVAALIREYLRKGHNYINPSSSLIKAIIISCAQKIENTRKAPLDNSLSEVGFPDFDQGYGIVNVSELLNSRKIKLNYSDVDNKDDKALESRAPIGGPVKSYREYTFEICENVIDVTVTLCWIDPPSKGVQNNLQLSMRIPSNSWEIGNENHLYKKSAFFDTTSNFNGKPFDKYNTTEKIFIKNAAVGKYLIKVSAQNTINSRQGYSLVVLGNVSDFMEKVIS